MKHWFAVPFGDDEESGRLRGWLHEHGWEATSWTWECGGPGGVYRPPGRSRVVVTVSPAWAPNVVGMTVISGVTLVYDDTEKSMGVTDRPEPEDARPAEPRDAEPSGWSLCCPGCGRPWTELPRLHTYGQNLGCWDVPHEDAVPGQARR